MRVPDEDRRERWRALRDLERWLEQPMVYLGVLWLALLVIELTRGLSRTLTILGTIIWILFIADFALRLTLAPDRRRYLAQNWLTIVSLIVPALRIFRVFRAFRVLRVGRAVRGARLVKVVGALNRAMRGAGRVLRSRHLGYVLVVTTLVMFAGAAGMYAFEREAATPSSGIRSYGDALWFTAMILTTFGSDYWPRTAEGRVLCVLLAIYTFSVFGYVTAALASWFIGQDRQRAVRDAPGAAVE